jgi:hypothetical protein
MLLPDERRLQTIVIGESDDRRCRADKTKKKSDRKYKLRRFCPIGGGLVIFLAGLLSIKQKMCQG